MSSEERKIYSICLGRVSAGVTAKCAGGRARLSKLILSLDQKTCPKLAPSRLRLTGPRKDGLASLSPIGLFSTRADGVFLTAKVGAAKAPLCFGPKRSL